jgi:hypothetical protein
LLFAVQKAIYILFMAAPGFNVRGFFYAVSDLNRILADPLYNRHKKSDVRTWSNNNQERICFIVLTRSNKS